MAKAAPRDLVKGGRGRKFWAAVVADWEPRPDEVEVLAEACRMLDLVDALRERVDEEGLVVVTPAGPKMHPCATELRQVRMELRRALGALNLESEDVELPAEVASLRSVKARRAARARWDRRHA